LGWVGLDVNDSVMVVRHSAAVQLMRGLKRR